MASKRPIGQLPQLATDATWSSGDETGNPTRVTMSAGDLAQGFLPNVAAPAAKANWLFGSQGDWISYLADLALASWHPYVMADSAAGAFDLTYHRSSGIQAQVFYSPSMREWIALGSNTAGKFWHGDHGVFVPETIAGGGPPKVSFGVDTGTKIVLFNHDATTNPPYAYSAAGDPSGAGFTSSTLSGAGVVIANDAVVLPSGKIVVCGHRASLGCVWISTDHGATFPTRVDVGSTSSAEGLTRIIVGQDLGGGISRLLAWVNDAAGGTTHGDVVWTSDDEGATWTQSSALGFSGISEGHYSADAQGYFFTSSDSVWVTSDPLTSSISQFTPSSGKTIASAQWVGNAIVALVAMGTSPTAPFQIYISRDAGTTWNAADGRAANSNYLAVNSAGQLAMQGNDRLQFSLTPGGL